MGYNVAVVGATGNVGREMLNILAERSFPVDEMHALASRRSIGVEVSFGDKTVEMQGPRAVRLLQGRHLPDVGRRQRVARNGRRASPPRAASSSTTPRPAATTRTCR